MNMRKVFKGDGFILFRGTEIPARYNIVAERTSLVSASGIAEVSPKDFVELVETSDQLQMRLSTGEVVEILFSGGNLGGPARIVVNSRMPGF